MILRLEPELVLPQASLSGTPVYRISLDVCKLYVFKTAHVDRRHLYAVRRAEAKGRAAANRAKMMIDDMLVESIGRKVFRRRLQSKLRARHEPKQIALPAAMGTIAFHYGIEVAFDSECDLPAMTTPFMTHAVLL
jgi:hypothetical protein